MQLTAAQIKTLNWLTNSITRGAQLSRGGEWMNGPVHFRIDDYVARDGSVMLSASNLSDQKKWFETYVHVIVWVGPRGGVRVAQVEGIGRYTVDPAGSHRNIVRRQERAALKAATV